jgi:hypothetical protein
MRREMNQDEFHSINELFKLIETETPKDYVKLIDEAIANDSLHVSTLMLSHLSQLLLNLMINGQGGYCSLEREYFKHVRDYIIIKSNEIYEIRDTEFFKKHN